MDQECESFAVVELHASVASHVGVDDFADLQHFNKLLDDRVSSQDEFGKRRIFLNAALHLRLYFFDVLCYNNVYLP